MAKSRDYLKVPRNAHEFDVDYRNDVDFGDEVSLTKQADAEAADINYIMRRYERTGELPEMIRQDAQYGDFSDAPTFMEAQSIVSHALSQFSALSAEVRAKFQNDPARMLAFVDAASGDPKKKEELYDLGLAVRKEVDPSLDALQKIVANTTPKG